MFISKRVLFFILFSFIKLCMAQKRTPTTHVLDTYKGHTIYFKSFTKEEFVTYQEEKKVKSKREKGRYIIFELQTGEVMVQYNHDYSEKLNTYYLYSNKEDFQNATKFARSSSFIMLNKNPYGAQFPKKSKELALQLLKTFGLSESDLYDAKSLEHIETKINSSSEPYRLYRENFISIIALIGELLIHKYTGAWKMKRADDKVTWNPILMVRNKRIMFFPNLYEDIFLNNNIEDILSFTYRVTEYTVPKNIK